MGERALQTKVALDTGAGKKRAERGKPCAERVAHTLLDRLDGTQSLAAKMELLPEADWRRLARYFSGEHAPAEEEATRAWIIESEERARLTEELARVWKATGQPPAKRDLERAWKNLGEKIDEASFEEAPRESFSEPFPEEVAARPPRASRCRGRSGRVRARRAVVAAIGALIVAGALLFALLQAGGLAGEDKRWPAGKTFTTKAGQRATVELTDGTRVRLNVGSTLTLAKAFSKGQREVRLEGEAFFDVATDAAHPFRVHTEGAIIEVKGTAFGVRAYAAEGETQVAVTEGQVVLRSTSPPPQGARDTTERDAAAAAEEEEAVLEPQHLGVVSRQRRPVVYRGVDLRPYLAWAEGRLVFEDASLAEVARQLERWYDLEVDVRVPPRSAGRFNATFEGEPLDVVLKTMVAALDVKYRREGRHVTFFSEHHVQRRRAQPPSSGGGVAAHL